MGCTNSVKCRPVSFVKTILIESTFRNFLYLCKSFAIFETVIQRDKAAKYLLPCNTLGGHLIFLEILRPILEKFHKLRTTPLCQIEQLSDETRDLLF